MKATLTPQQLGAWLARIGSIVMVVLAAIPADALPSSVRPYFAVAGAVILAVDRYVTDPSTGTPAGSTPTAGPRRIAKGTPNGPREHRTN